MTQPTPAWVAHRIDPQGRLDEQQRIRWTSIEDRRLRQVVVDPRFAGIERDGLLQPLDRFIGPLLADQELS